MGHIIHQQYAANNEKAMNMARSVIKPWMVSQTYLERQRERGCKITGRQNNFLL